MTYSIVAADPATGACGVAVQSKFPAIGALSAWAEPGVGAVATQAWINPNLGRQALVLLAQGVSSNEVLDRIITGDSGRDQRQVGLVDVKGISAAYTGSGCMEHAGHRLGKCYAVQGNLLASDRAIPAMAEAFGQSAGLELAERLLICLEAAESEGGDRRGRQGAAVKVVAPGEGYGGGGIVVDLRVDDDPEPLLELRRLWRGHLKLFGRTPESEWLEVGPALRQELSRLLSDRGWSGPDLEANLDGWAGVENMEERVCGVERLDPVVLKELRGG